ADPHRRFLRLRNDLAGAAVCALLDLGRAAKGRSHRLRELVLLGAEPLDLLAPLLHLALELAVAVAQRLEVVVELAQGQAQLRERELDVLATVAAAEPLVAERRTLISVRCAHGRPTSYASSPEACFRSPFVADVPDASSHSFFAAAKTKVAQAAF